MARGLNKLYSEVADRTNTSAAVVKTVMKARRDLMLEIAQTGGILAVLELIRREIELAEDEGGEAISQQ